MQVQGIGLLRVIQVDIAALCKFVVQWVECGGGFKKAHTAAEYPGFRTALGKVQNLFKRVRFPLVVRV